ncbi:nitronate monooxygenase family protein [Peribacillus frigoritolerans]|uniref:NAD(P)H-dependent flavin oxidoreductase n=1 Tax=Peribacillus frigoritolerans TaxID=450367 RepID=UPI002B255021|nr:nitronate monooxygenase family protein [Peribacillus frigoritolerans]MEB2627945.1 nitronate monooxygenase family protein [Peribacillus frigoritolerans]
MKTRMTELLGIEYPIICGGMFQVGRAPLAAAVSEAGGLGIITSKTQVTPEGLRDEIRKVKTLTKKPFAVNLNLFPSQTATPNDEFIDILIEEDVKIVETSGRSPESLMPRLKEHGFIVLHKVANVKNAVSAEKLGVDAIIIVGNETGGHPGMGDVGTLVMLPRAVDSVNIPVIAGGGFSDGRGLISALSLGAEGIVMGTRFMATQEAPIHENVKQWMVSANETDTVVIQRNIGSPSRVALNAVSKEVDKLENEGATIEELIPLITGQRSKEVYFEGNLDGGIWSCGQSVGLIKEILTVNELIKQIVQEAKNSFEFIQSRIESIRT